MGTQKKDFGAVSQFSFVGGAGYGGLRGPNRGHEKSMSNLLFLDIFGMLYKRRSFSLGIKFG